MATRHLLVTLIGAAALGSAAAQTLKPGLWQITHRGQGGGADPQAMARMQQQMAAMSPEQRKTMQEMLGKQGMQMGRPGAGGAMTMNVCMTPEMVRRDQLPSQRGDCSSSAQARSGNVMRFAFACTNPPSKGQGEVTFASPEAYTSKVTVTTTVQGRQREITSESSGKWLAADCGNVKPFAPGRK